MDSSLEVETLNNAYHYPTLSRVSSRFRIVSPCSPMPSHARRLHRAILRPSISRRSDTGPFSRRLAPAASPGCSSRGI